MRSRRVPDPENLTEVRHRYRGLGHRNEFRFIWEPIAIAIFLWVLYIALPIFTNIGNQTTQLTIANNPGLNASQKATIQNMGNGFFDNSPDIMMFILYVMLILASFIAAGYEGANPAVTLLLGLFFLVVGTIVSFPMSDFAYAWMHSPSNIGISVHYGLTTYIMEYLPYFNGILIIAYIVFVITRKEQFVAGFSQIGGGGGVGGSVVNT